MAWLSIGVSNDDMCNKLIQYRVLKDERIIEVFRQTDRGDFVHAEDRQFAYQDRPYKRGALHLSAPHMYVSVLEELELQEGQAFLNIGSGSGYLSCLASHFLGSSGICHGIEINPTLVAHSRNCIAEWERKREVCETQFGGNISSSICGSESKLSRHKCNIAISEGNCFNIDVTSTSRTCLYDRIYVGAGCPDAKKEFFYSLLADNGIIVIPIVEKNEMVLVKKFAGNVFSKRHISHVHFAPLLDVPIFHVEDVYQQLLLPTLVAIDQEIFSTEDDIVIVRSNPSSRAETRNNGESSSQSNRSDKIRLPALVWEPNKARHKQFPSHFRNVVRAILLANRSRYPPTANTVSDIVGCGKKNDVVQTQSACGRLPIVVWFHVLSFATRDWFTPQRSLIELLQIELMAERKLRHVAEEKLALAVNGKRAAERERDLLRIVVARLSHRRGDASSYYEEDGEEEEEEDADDESISISTVEEEEVETGEMLFLDDYDPQVETTDVVAEDGGDIQLPSEQESSFVSEDVSTEEGMMDESSTFSLVIPDQIAFANRERKDIFDSGMSMEELSSAVVGETMPGLQDFDSSMMEYLYSDEYAVSRNSNCSSGSSSSADTNTTGESNSFDDLVSTRSFCGSDNDKSYSNMKSKAQEEDVGERNNSVLFQRQRRMNSVLQPLLDDDQDAADQTLK